MKEIEAIRQLLSRADPKLTEGIRQMLTRGGPELLHSLSKTEAKTIKDTDPNEPMTVITMYWPSEIDGSLRAACLHCKRYVSLAPSTQEMISKRTSPTRLLCLNCAMREIESSTVVQ